MRRNYFVNPTLADALEAGNALFVDQVGKADVYIDRQQVAEIVKDWHEDLPIDKHGATYSYQHAALKYPRIAHKMKAMRAMTWGAEE